MATPQTEILKFVPFTSSVDVSFWFELARQKLEFLKLDERDVALSAFHSISTTGDQTANFSLDSSSFKLDFIPPTNTFPSKGIIMNKNTIESFKGTDLMGLANRFCDEIWNRIEAGNLTDLNPWSLLSFSDLKKYTFTYWFLFPVLVHLKDVLNVIRKTPITSALTAVEMKILAGQTAKHVSAGEPIFLMKKTEHEIKTSSLATFETFYDSSNTTVVVAAQNGPENALNWISRNVLTALKVGKKLPHVKVLDYRCERHSMQNIEASEFLEIDLLPNSTWTRSDMAGLGWEKDKRGKNLPKSINLSSAMDKTKLASNAVDLNLKLMRWRLLPNLQLEKVAGTRCLLFGAGTLGCNVARNLMAWGVRHITFVDNGKVSYSNPVRQWLYTFEDSAEGRPKATTAAERCKQVFPELITKGVELNIPMPGHLVSSDDEKAKAMANVATIESLIDEHDVSFLLLDSRESRWLPTLISEAKGKPVITTALGFDNFVVMRHGVHHSRDGKAIVRGESGSSSKVSLLDSIHSSALGCYFCNDVVAPQDSLKDRTLDQQCTVTRPGLSSMASSTAVEMMVSMLHHPLAEQAPADPKTDIGSDTSTELGIVPHQIRGYLSFFSNLIITGHRYDKCVACSDQVVDSYSQNRQEFLINAFNNPKSLEDITGITAMKMEEAEVINDTWETESEISTLGEKNDLDDF